MKQPDEGDQEKPSKPTPAWRAYMNEHLAEEPGDGEEDKPPKLAPSWLAFMNGDIVSEPFHEFAMDFELSRGRDGPPEWTPSPRPGVVTPASGEDLRKAMRDCCDVVFRPVRHDAVWAPRDPDIRSLWRACGAWFAMGEPVFSMEPLPSWITSIEIGGRSLKRAELRGDRSDTFFLLAESRRERGDQLFQKSVVETIASWFRRASPVADDAARRRLTGHSSR